MKKCYNINKLLTFAVFNARSVCNKALSLHDIIIDHDLDIVAITETWLRDEASDVITNLVPDGYAMINVPRKDKAGGGVALLYKSNLKLKQCRKIKPYTSFESLECVLTLKTVTYRILVIYRPPSNSVNKLTYKVFSQEIEECITDMSTKYSDVLICGDLNVHFDNTTSAATQQMDQLLHGCDLSQLVKMPTHKIGHTLDVVITRNKDLLSDFKVHDLGALSDHFLVSFRICDKKPSSITKHKVNRNIRGIDLKSFRKDLVDAIPGTNTGDKLDVEQYHNNVENAIKSILDTHAPAKTKSYIVRPNTQWYTSNLRAAKVIKRRRERKWKKSGLDIDYTAYKSQCKLVNHLLTKAKTEFYSQQVIDCGQDQKRLFNVTKGILNWKSTQTYPSTVAAETLPCDFNDFFINKVIKIRNVLDLQSQTFAAEDVIAESNASQPSQKLTQFSQATTDEVRKIILTSSSATCELDSVPTSLFKECIEEILLPTTNIINLSLSQAKIPRKMKESVVIPLLKKANLNPDEFKNYRPISNLGFISKILEKIVAKRLNDHNNKHCFFSELQSAYRTFHSTETALLRVQNDILSALHEKRMVMLVLLDLTAAFDTIDHSVLLARLKHRFGIDGLALKWIQSYLSDRSQYVNISGTKSHSKTIGFGVPQGSVLGPLLFIMYTSPLSDIASQYSMGHHFYADDAQLYISFKSGSSEEVTLLEKCITDFKMWMRQNMLKLNDDKTEFLLIGSPYYLNETPCMSINVGDISISSSEVVNNLGAMFDNRLTMEKFVLSKVSSCMFFIRSIARIRKYLTLEAAKLLMHAYVISRLDYANSLLVGVSKGLIEKLQRVQNYAARVILSGCFHDSSDDLLNRLHWLPVHKRIVFKIATFIYKSLTGDLPQYIRELIPDISVNEQIFLRSNLDQNLEHPTLAKSSYGHRLLLQYAPWVWNSLPPNVKQANNIKSFKKYLKTHLFSKLD